MADAAIKALTEGQSLRVWSFIVTLFGDLARAPGAYLPGATLTALTGRVAIKPASMRVALHRLRKDGWLESQRAGRTSAYFLTEYGRRETLAATKRIYAPNEHASDLWHLLVAPPGGREALEARAPDGMNLLPGIVLGMGPAPQVADCLALSGTLATLPDWVRSAIVSSDLRADYASFEARLSKVTRLLPDQISDLDRAVLRGLIVHGWRRLLLRHPDLPDDFLGPDCRIGPSRKQVMALLERLGPVDARALPTAASQATL